MLKKTAVALIAMVLLLAGFIQSRPNEFKITRETTIKAPASVVFAQVNDFHNWANWSPWAKLDPNAKNTFEGPQTGKGAAFRWNGNDKIGEGVETIIDSIPNELVRIRLEFIKPFPGVNTVDFKFKAEGEQTTVSWTMYGPMNFVGKMMSLFMDCDKFVGAQFEKGLADLKAVSEK